MRETSACLENAVPFWQVRSDGIALNKRDYPVRSVDEVAADDTQNNNNNNADCSSGGNATCEGTRSIFSHYEPQKAPSVSLPLALSLTLPPALGLVEWVKNETLESPQRPRLQRARILEGSGVFAKSRCFWMRALIRR